MGNNPRARVSSVRECDRGVLLFLYMLRGRRWVILTSSLQVHLYHYPFQVWHLINLLNQSLIITIINNTPCIRQVGFGVDSGLVVVATVIIFLICGFYYYFFIIIIIIIIYSGMMTTLIYVKYEWCHVLFRNNTVGQIFHI